MKLTVITINRNNATGLEKTIKSVISQSYTDFEYLIIDGKSTDDSVNVIQKYEDRITFWVSEKDSGIYNAMNKGINKANGEYLLFLNSGDFLLNNDVLQTVFSEEQSAEFLCCNIQYSNKEKVVHTTNLPNKITFGTLYTEGLPHQATFIKRNTFDKYGLYREDYKYIADIEYWYRTIILNCCTTKTIKLVLADYNLDGLSSQPIMNGEKRETDIEFERIIDTPFFQLFVPDYNYFEQRKADLFYFDWLKKHRILYWLVILFYKVEKKLIFFFKI